MTFTLGPFSVPPQGFLHLRPHLAAPPHPHPVPAPGPRLPERSASCEQSSSHSSVGSPCVSGPACRAGPASLTAPAQSASPPRPRSPWPHLGPRLYQPRDYRSWWQWEAKALVTEEQRWGLLERAAQPRRTLAARTSWRNLGIGDADPGSRSRRFLDPCGFCF